MRVVYNLEIHLIWRPELFIDDHRSAFNDTSPFDLRGYEHTWTINHKHRPPDKSA